MDVVFLIYGLSFLAVGVTVAIRYDHDSRLELAGILWLLAAFGFVHGFREWMDLWRIVRGDNAALAAMRPIVLLASYIPLFEFGRRLFRISLAAGARLSVAGLLKPWIHVPLLAAIAAGTAAADQPEIAMDVWSRYLLGFPGAVLAGLGFLAYRRQHLVALLGNTDSRLVDAAFTVTGVAFVAYGVFGGLIVPRQNWLPASAINQDSFLAALHLPIQVARALCAVLIAVGVGFLLKVFHLEGVERLRRSEKRFHGMADNAQDAIIEIDAAGRIGFWNAAAEKLFGYSSKEAVGRDLHDLIIPKRFRSGFHAAFPRFVATGEGMMLGRSVELVGLRNDGREVFVEVTIGALSGATGRHAIGILRDVTERREIEQQLKLGQQVITHAHDGIIITDNDVRIQLVNPAFTRITGYSPKDVVGKTPSLLRSGRHSPEFYADMWHTLKVSGEWKGEIWNRRRDGATYPEWLSLSAIPDSRGHITNYVGIFSDITKRKEAERHLERLAFFDPLTGLPNRILLRERLEQALRQLKRQGGYRVAVLYLDLDFFKKVNDQYGHDVGDLLLEEAGRRMSEALRETDTIARVGGDEFAIALTHVVCLEVAASIAEKIVTLLSRPFLLKDRHCQIGTSIGIALAPEHGTDVEELIVAADSAMYDAKRGGRNQFRFAAGVDSTTP